MERRQKAGPLKDPWGDGEARGPSRIPPGVFQQAEPRHKGRWLKAGTPIDEGPGVPGQPDQHEILRANCRDRKSVEDCAGLFKSKSDQGDIDE